MSEALGKKTVRTVGKGESEGQSVGPNPHENEGKSTNYGEAARDLLMPSEVLQLGRDTAILFAPDSKPQYLRPVDFWALPDAFGRFRDVCPNLFWDPPLQYDPNPLFPGSQGSGSVPPKAELPRTAAKQPYDFATYAPKPEASPVQPSKVVPFDWSRYAPKPQSKAPEKPVAETSGSKRH